MKEKLQTLQRVPNDGYTRAYAGPEARLGII
jgi:hypothetical protein